MCLCVPRWSCCAWHSGPVAAAWVVVVWASAEQLCSTRCKPGPWRQRQSCTCGCPPSYCFWPQACPPPQHPHPTPTPRPAGGDLLPPSFHCALTHSLTHAHLQDNICVLKVMGHQPGERARVAHTSGYIEWLKEQGGSPGNDTVVPTNDGSDPAAVRKCELA